MNLSLIHNFLVLSLKNGDEFAISHSLLAPVSIIYDMVESPEEQQVTGVDGGCVSAL